MPLKGFRWFVSSSLDNSCNVHYLNIQVGIPSPQCFRLRNIFTAGFQEFRWWSKSGLGASRCWHLFPHLAASKLLTVLIRWHQQAAHWHPDWHIWLTPGGSRSGAQVDFWYIKNQTLGFMYSRTPGHILTSMIIHQHYSRSNMLNCWPLQSEEVCLPVV